MLNLWKLLGGSWDDSKQGLQDDLEHIEAAINQHYSQTFDKTGKLQVTALPAEGIPLDVLPEIDPSTLLGRGSLSGVGTPQTIILGTNLSMAGTVLSASGSGGGSSTVVTGPPGRDGEDGYPFVPVIPSPMVFSAVGIVIDGAGVPITTGVKGFIQVPFDCTITAATLLSSDTAVTSGSIVIDVWKDVYANYPPTVGDTITASAKPTLTGATQFQDNTLTGWTKSIRANDVLGFNVDSVSSIIRATLVLTVRR